MYRSLIFASLLTAVYALDNINFGAFTPTATYSVAQQLGFFTAVDLNVTYLQIANSQVGYANLLNGTYDVLTGTLDNVLNLYINSNASVTALGQLDGGPDLVLASTANITTVQQLRGKPIIVDSPMSGYSYILRRFLSLHGLLIQNNDYSFQTAGATTLRVQYLLNGALPNTSAVYATILTYPYTQTALSQSRLQGRPINILARASDYAQPFVSSAFTAAQGSIRNGTASRDKIVRFVAAMYAANAFLLDAKNQACVFAALQKQLNVSATIASAEYEAATDLVSGETGSATNFTFNRQGLLNVLDIRSQFDGFVAINNGEGFDFINALEPGTVKMIDYNIRDEAVAGVLGGKWKDLKKWGSRKACGDI